LYAVLKHDALTSKVLLAPYSIRFQAAQPHMDWHAHRPLLSVIEVMHPYNRSDTETAESNTDGGTLLSYLIQKFIQSSSKPNDTSFKNVGHFHHLCEGRSLNRDNTDNKIKLMESQQAFLKSLIISYTN